MPHSFKLFWLRGERRYLQTALNGTKHLLRHKDDLQFMYRRTSGLTRFLLPLGFLNEHDDSGEIARGLDDILQYLISRRNMSGGIEEADNPEPERFGQEDAGVFNDNGEGISDQLYTNNFLVMNAWEVWKRTGNERFRELYEDVSGFMRRIQIRSRWH